MTLFANEAINELKVECKKCKQIVIYGKDKKYCPKCGTPIIDASRDGKLEMDDFDALYNYFYNNDEDIFSDKAKEIFEFYVKSLYSSIEVETIPIINSALRSGYSIRLTEEKIFDRPNPSIKNLKLLLKKASKEIIEKTDIKVDGLDKKAGNMLILAAYLTVDHRYENYYLLEKKGMNRILASIIEDNCNYLISDLKTIFEGKTLLHSLNGMPRVWTKPIEFDTEMQNNWIQYITSDTIFGYCLRLIELEC